MGRGVTLSALDDLGHKDSLWAGGVALSALSALSALEDRSHQDSQWRREGCTECTGGSESPGQSVGRGVALSALSAL